MEITVLIKGILTGLLVAVPVGPIGLLCMRKSLQNGRLSGFVSGLGTASVDTLYGLIAALGVTFIADFLLGYQVIFRLLVGIILLYLGYKVYSSKINTKPIEVSFKGYVKDYFSTFLLTLANPPTILFFAAIATQLGIAQTKHLLAFMFAGGIFIGSAIWWLILSNVISSLKTKLSDKWIQTINKSSGVVFILFGLIVLLSLI